MTALAAWRSLSPSSPPLQKSSTRPWTLLWYAAADNNCDGPVQELLESMRQALDDGDFAFLRDGTAANGVVENYLRVRKCGCAHVRGSYD